jgi:hypothetical protein
MFTPQVQGLLPGKVDVIGHLSVNPDQSRLLSFKQGPLTVAKFRRSWSPTRQRYLWRSSSNVSITRLQTYSRY